MFLELDLRLQNSRASLLRLLRFCLKDNIPNAEPVDLIQGDSGTAQPTQGGSEDTVETPIKINTNTVLMDPLRSGQPLYSGQAACYGFSYLH